MVLGVLDDGAQQTGKERCDTNAHPSVEPLWESVGERQPQREEEENVHQHLAVKLGLGAGGGKGGKGTEDEIRRSPRTVGQSCIEDSCKYQERCQGIHLLPEFCGYIPVQSPPDSNTC